MKSPLILFLLVTLIPPLSRDEVDVLKKDGTVVSGYLENMEGDKISIRQYNGSSVTIRQSEITKMIFIDNVSGRKRWALKEFHILTNQDSPDITRLFILSQCDELSRLEREQLLSRFEKNYSKFKASEAPQIFGIGDFEDEYYLSIIANINTKVTKLEESIALSGALDIMCPVPQDAQSLFVSSKIRRDRNNSGNAEFYYSVKEFIIYERRDLLNPDNNMLGFEGAKFTSPQELTPEPEWYNNIPESDDWYHSRSFVRSKLPFASTGRITFCIISLNAVNCLVDDLSIMATNLNEAAKDSILPAEGETLYRYSPVKGLISDPAALHEKGKPSYNVNNMGDMRIKYPSTGRIKVSYFTTNPGAVKLSISPQTPGENPANINKEVRDAQAMNRVQRSQENYQRGMEDKEAAPQSTLKQKQDGYFMGDFDNIFTKYKELSEREEEARKKKAASREEISQITDLKQELIDRFIERIITEWYPINTYKINRVINELTQQNERYGRGQRQKEGQDKAAEQQVYDNQQRNFAEFRRDVINRLEGASLTIQMEQQLQTKESLARKALSNDMSHVLNIKPKVTLCICNSCKADENNVKWFKCELILDLASYTIDSSSYVYLRLNSTAKEEVFISDLVVTVSK